MFKKTTVLAMALGALVAFALPMSATADWQHNHQKLPKKRNNRPHRPTEKGNAERRIRVSNHNRLDTRTRYDRHGGELGA